MGNNRLRYVCLVEMRRLLLLMGVVFGFFLFFQYFELPYIGIFSSLFETSKSQVASADDLPSRHSSTRPTASSDLTLFRSSNSTDLNVGNGISNNTNVSEGMDSEVKNAKDDLDLEKGITLNDTLNGDIDIDLEDEFQLTDFLGVDHNSTIDRAVRNNSFFRENDDEVLNSVGISNSSASVDHDGIRDAIPTERDEDKLSNQHARSVTKQPPPHLLETGSTTSVQASPSIATTGKDAENILQNNENPEILKAVRSATGIDPSIGGTREAIEGPEPAVVPLSKMNDMLLESRVSYKTVKMRQSSRVDQELQNVKSLIENAPVIKDDPQFDFNLYRNFSAFKRSYELMEQTLKVYIYAEGERPIFHQPPLKGIYASEGWFMKLLKSNKKFITKKPKKAHLFYLPFSSRMLEVALYVPNSHNRKPLIKQLSNYIQLIKTKHNFWNRTDGADHFLVACHDWAPAETRQTMANCIRALCNADVREGFRFSKDASLPETFVQTPQNPLRQLGGKPPSQRRILAFFAGNMHGYLRPILLNYWENKDPDMKIFGRIRKGKGQMSYAQYMKSSKYCICARGFEVNSPRVVEAIFYECVPVIISDNFVPPFFETLNWESFAVFVAEKDIPNLKNILVSISKKRYLEMQQRVKKVQQHFLWHSRPVRYDVFHMILHSVWYNRVLSNTALVG